MIRLKISVRDLVEYSLRKGDIDFKYTGRTRGVQGTKLHQKIQKEYGELDQKEVLISDTFFYGDLEITLSGRIDGVLSTLNGFIIDEIKSTKVLLENLTEDYTEIHWAQGIVYAFLYSKINGYDKIYVQLTYCHVESKEIKRFIKLFNYKELEDYVMYDLLNSYTKWATKLYNNQIKRDNSIESMDFPYKDYRNGQRKIIVALYKTITEKKKIFINAPTGIGKTISTLFPSILNLQKKNVEKIFYLTSKNTQKQVVQDTLYHLNKRGVHINYCTITAKEKICLNDIVQCNPTSCSYAKGHFNRINEAIEDIFINENLYNKEIIISYAKKHNVCSFEFSLDLSLWSDIVIADYNYIFDPRVSLKRFTEEKGKYVYLIDECHNLVERTREMYSCQLSKDQFFSLRKTIGKEHPLYTYLGKINKEFLYIKKQDNYQNTQEPTQLIKELQFFVYKGDAWLSEHNNNEDNYNDILNLYFEVNNFIRISEYYDTNYRTIVEEHGSNIFVKLLCLDTAMYINSSTNNGISSAFFSATLIPLPYYIEVLGGNIKEDYHMSIESPFLSENMDLIINDEVLTIYKYREKTYTQISVLINNSIKWKSGNYLVFFPSYEYMEKVYNIYVENYTNTNTIIQSKYMAENERNEYLENFQIEENVLAFAVLGGIFSESIDLVGEKLIGTIIISTGIPKICEERNLIRQYYQEKNNKGYQYAYMYPGFNKVMQAAGRVIRTENDKGVVVLIDKRYSQNEYRLLFPNHWNHYKNIVNLEDMNKELKSFWKSTQPHWDNSQ